MLQWPGQEIKASQGEHGYAPAPPEPPPPFSWATYKEPGTDITDINPDPRVVDTVSNVAGAAARGWSNTPTISQPFFGVGNAVREGVKEAWRQIPSAPSVDPSAPPPGDTQLTADQYAREHALNESANKSGYFALEPSEPGFTHLLWSLGAPFAKIGQTALGERPFPTGTDALEMAAPLAGAGDLRFTPRVHPLMKPYNDSAAALEAAKQYGPPEPPTVTPVTPGPQPSGVAQDSFHTRLRAGAASTITDTGGSGASGCAARNERSDRAAR